MITNIIDQDLISQAKVLIEPVQKIAIVTHTSPDGDAIGSSLGMLHFLRDTGKQHVRVIVPNRFPHFLDWMPLSETILAYDDNTGEADAFLSAADLIIGIDFNQLSRLEKMQDAVKNAPAKKILLDHHLYPDNFADVTISYPQISSASEIVFRLICRMGMFKHISKQCAECIYTGMMTDTGNFSYNSNDSEIYNIISELLKKGIDKDAIYRNVNNTYSEDRMRFMGYCLYRKMKVYPEYHTALIAIRGRELFRFNYQPGDAEGFVNMPLSIEGVYFSVFMREDKDKIKISLRSQGDFPANKVAAELFNGGGHLNAAGGESYATLDETIEKFENALPKYF